MSDNFSPYQEQEQKIVIEQKQSNPLGLTGFILSLCAIVLGWIPVLNFILWILGLIFSAIGMFKQPKGFAIAGLAISLLGIILLIAFLGTILAMIGMSV